MTTIMDARVSGGDARVWGKECAPAPDFSILFLLLLLLGNVTFLRRIEYIHGLPPSVTSGEAAHKW